YLFAGQFTGFFWRYLLIILLAGVIITGADYLVHSAYGIPYSATLLYHEPAIVVSNYMMLFFVVSSALSFSFFREKLQVQKKLEDTEKERTKAELMFLKAQINPHFLFNLLNTVHFQIDKTNTTARDTLTRMSDLLRYQLYEVQQGKVPV